MDDDVLNGLSRQEFEDYRAAGMKRFPYQGGVPKPFEIRVASYEELVAGVTAIKDDENGGIWVPGWIFVAREEMLKAKTERETAAK